MGRRSINTTKSGKYMNPTDQARKFNKIIYLITIRFQPQQVMLTTIKAMVVWGLYYIMFREGFGLPVA